MGVSECKCAVHKNISANKSQCCLQSFFFFFIQLHSAVILGAANKFILSGGMCPEISPTAARWSWGLWSVDAGELVAKKSSTKEYLLKFSILGYYKRYYFISSKVDVAELVSNNSKTEKYLLRTSN